MRAEVGDEQHGDDPTVHELCDRMAALMGKQAAMYLPSGTMCNVIAILTHCGKGDEVIAHETSHILHSDGPDACLRLIRKAVGALEPGGLIIVHEFILDDTLDGPVFPALFSLNMLLGTESGRAYSEAEIRSMLAAAGVRDIRRVPVKTPNDSGVISGIV